MAVLEERLDDIEKEIARLEERTKPKPKSTIDLLKEWCGFLSLIIAIGYTFPLGLWDRFFDTTAARSAEIADLYSVLEDISQMISERTMLGPQMPQAPAPTMAIDSTVMARVDLLMSRRKDRFVARKDDLTFSALFLASQNFAMTADYESARVMLDEAIERSSLNLEMQLAAMREKATLLFVATPLQDQKTGRELFSQILSRVPQLDSRKAAFISASTLARWAVAELNDGDWKCGMDRLQLGQADAMKQLPPEVGAPIFGPIHAEIRSGMLKPRPDQLQVGC